MAAEDFPVIEKDPKQEKAEPQNGNGNSRAESGFGLVNWLFDHVREREPIFLSLYKGYDRHIKLSGPSVGRFQKTLGLLLLLGCLLWDGIVFLIYGISVVLIIAGITFIFLKGTGVLDYLHKTPPPGTAPQIVIKSDHIQIVEEK